MRVSVGNLLTIRGANFKPQRRRNTVIFRGAEGRTAFAKPIRATRRKLVVRVPAAVARLLRVVASRQRPTRLKLRVLAGKFSKYTPRRLSPVVTGVGDGDGGDGGGGGTIAACDSSADHDGDLLANSLELAIGTDPCLADTDVDQISDGWEYWSAKDLQHQGRAVSGQASVPERARPVGRRRRRLELQRLRLRRRWSHDARGVPRLALHRQRLRPGPARAWASSPPSATATARSTAARATSRACPAWRSAGFGLANPSQPFPATYDLHGNAGRLPGRRA